MRRRRRRRGCWGGECGSVVDRGRSSGVLTCRKLLSLTKPQMTVDGKAGAPSSGMVHT